MFPRDVFKIYINIMYLLSRYMSVSEAPSTIRRSSSQLPIYCRTFRGNYFGNLPCSPPGSASCSLIMLLEHLFDICTSIPISVPMFNHEKGNFESYWRCFIFILLQNNFWLVIKNRFVSTLLI